MKDTVIKFIFFLNVFIFFIAPLISPLLPITSKRTQYQSLRVYYRALTGVAFEFKMFAPTNSHIKYDADFILYKKSRPQPIKKNWRELIPFNYRIQLLHLLGFNGARTVMNKERDLVQITRFMKNLNQRLDSHKSKVVITKYTVPKLIERKKLQKEVLWKYEVK